MSRDVSGPLELSIEINRCDVAMTKCEKHPTLKFSELCKKLKDKNAFYYGALSTIHPPFECPVKAQNYVSTNSSIDLSALSFLPISGYSWLTTFKLTSGEGKRKELVLCVMFECKILRAKARRNKN